MLIFVLLYTFLCTGLRSIFLAPVTGGYGNSQANGREGGGGGHVEFLTFVIPITNESESTVYSSKLFFNSLYIFSFSFLNY